MSDHIAKEKYPLPPSTPTLRTGADGKIDASIIRKFDSYAFALDAFGQEYFIYHNNVEMMGRHGFDDLRTGSTVRLTPILENRKGWRGIEVEIVTP